MPSVRLAVAALVACAGLAGCTGSGSSSGGSTDVTQSVVLQAEALPGSTLSAALLRAASDVVDERLTAARLSFRVDIAGDGLRLGVDPASREREIRLATTRGSLRLRQVLRVAPGASSSPTPAARAEPVPGSSSRDPQAAERFFAGYDCATGLAPTLGIEAPSDFVVACDTTGQFKYLLAPTSVDDKQITTASAVQNTANNQWLVQLSFSKAGGRAFYDVTKRAYEADPTQSLATCRTAPLDKGCNGIAMVLDGTVISAPSSEQDGIKGGQTQIAGTMSEAEAKDLVLLLKSGPLPLRLVAP